MCGKRFHKSRFSNGFVDDSINFLIKEIDSFRSNQLVEPDLLVCMPARGDRIKVRIDEIDKTLCAYIIFQQYQKIPNPTSNKKNRKQTIPKCHKIN